MLLNMAVRMHGKNDLRLDTFELPPIKDDEILVRVVSDSICMSTYKAAIQGTAHKRVPADVAEHPSIVGHEFCGVIEQVGTRWAGRYRAGERFAIQPNINYRDTLMTPGYAFEYCGGDTQRAILLPEIMEQDCLLPYSGPAFFLGSLAEPLSCVICAFRGQYHTRRQDNAHEMGIRPDGNMAILGGAGPMGLAAIEYALHGDRQPGLLLVTDIDKKRLKRAASIYTTEAAEKLGIRLVYVDPNDCSTDEMLALTDGKGYDDVFVFTPKPEVIAQGDALLNYDGCMNFFAGPTDREFSAAFNFYDVHYAAHHLVGTSGGTTDDMVTALEQMASGKLDPSGMVTHIGGLDAAAAVTLDLPNIPGGKKLIYTGIRLPLTAIEDFEAMGERDPLFRTLSEICNRHNGLWSAEAEAYLLSRAQPL